ncbi:copper-binding protein [Rhodobacteraceae bacterium WD3A24]|nr:copper-binding protein [Rhodobacteraceae bacterium WD3A24]
MTTDILMRAAAAAALALPLATAPLAAQENGPTVHVRDAYARVATPMSRSGAAFMVIENTGEADDRLIAADTDAAEVVELHTHIESDDGVMQMVEVEEGFSIPAGETHILARGGDHVMMMGLTRRLEHGDAITLTLTFDEAGEVTLEVPVDLERMPGQGEGMQQRHGN